MKMMWMVFVLLFAACQDIRERKIPNTLILLGISGICIFRYAAEGGNGLLSAVFSCLITIGVFLPLFLIHAFGAGDIKLFSLVSAMHGLEEAFQVCILWFMLSGVVSLGKLLLKHRLYQRFAYAWRYARSGIRAHVPYYDRKRDGEKDTIPLAPFLAAAYLLIKFQSICRVCSGFFR